VVAHNHPDHDSEPSDADLTFTENLEAAGKVLGIEVQDHIIIGTDSWTSIMQYRVNKTKNVATKAAKPPPKSKVSWTRGVA
jgi:proteasome lid subunit RPN8/RPN11